MKKDRTYWKSRALAAEQALARADEQNDKLFDRLQAASLTEFKSHHGGFAMPEPEPPSDDEWATDATGAIREKLPPLTEAEMHDIIARQDAGVWE